MKGYCEVYRQFEGNTRKEDDLKHVNTITGIPLKEDEFRVIPILKVKVVTCSDFTKLLTHYNIVFICQAAILYFKTRSVLPVELHFFTFLQDL